VALSVQRLRKNISSYLGETIDIGAVLSDCLAAARHHGWSIEEIPVPSKPSLYALTRSPSRITSHTSRIYLSTGIHGDEPAGPLAVRQLLQENQWPENSNISLCPCLNPTGFRLNRRENDQDADLNRQYLNTKAPESLAHIAWLNRQPSFDLCLCLHEDWESDGFYVYELNPDGRVSLADHMVAQVAEVCPVDLSEVIEGRPAQNGIIRPSVDPRSRPDWPESFYLLTYKTRLSYTVEAPSDVGDIKRQQLEAVQRWYFDDWMGLEKKLRSSIVEGVSIFLSLFDINPAVKRVFCPPKETYDPTLNNPDEHGRYPYGRPLPSLNWLIEQGKICALNFPVSLNAGLARILGTMLKLDFERAVLLRIPEIERNKQRYFRQVFLMCDEYQTFATVGESDPIGDEKFFSLSRQSKCISIVATQSISSLRSSLPGDSWRTLLQTFRTKIFLCLSDDFSAKIASELCGREDRLKVSYNLSESGHDASVSLLTGKAVSHRANITASKSYNTQTDYRFDMKTFTELMNAQSVAIAYDGLNPIPPTFCYLKPYYNDPNKSYFEQLARGEL